MATGPGVSITVNRGETGIALAFEPTLPSEDATGQVYTIEIGPPRAEATWTTAITRERLEQLARRSGAIVLHIPAGDIPDGSAELRMRRQGETADLLRIPFGAAKSR